MRFRRGFRRKPKVRWMPLPGSHLDQNGGTLPKVLQNPSPVEFFAATLSGAPVTFAAPLVVDNPIEEQVAGTTLAVYQQFGLNQAADIGWRLRRIVGDIFISAIKVSTQSAVPPGVLVEAGIIVRRVDSLGQPVVSADAQDVGALENEADPWVWRRSWALSNGVPPSSSDLRIHTVNAFPPTNVNYGTKHHIAVDQKTNRRLGAEERLFLNVTFWEIPLDQTATGSPTTDDHVAVYFLMPYRVLGTVLTNAGNRRNATR